MRKTCGSRTIALPIATRWRCPPESVRGFLPRLSASPSVRAASVTLRWISGFGILRCLSPKAMLSNTVMCG